jgi:ornithine cyclodeaminase/alanine dehydrogenase-like protein (mu-crystallin family)
VIGAGEIRRRITPARAIAAMRDALLAQARGACDTPMPMHLDRSPAGGGEVHIESSYCRAGPSGCGVQLASDTLNCG